MNGTMSTDLVGSLLSSLSLQGDADGLIPHCPYDFIIAMDLEATCDENHADPSAIQVPRDKGEIIELSYAVVSVPERRIVHQRQNFVRPEETVVTPFCTQLTGITPETVANAGTLREAVDDLLSFVQTNPQSTFCFMAHGEWDFRYQLPRECQEKGIPLPSLFTSFFDITKEVQRMMSLSAGFTRPTNRASLLSLCKMMGLQHEGRLHNGLDDAVTVARLAIVLLQRVHTHFAEKPDAPLAPGFELPLTFPIDLAHEIENFVVARSRVIRLGGIPFKATQSQVSNFIGQSGVQSESVWMIRNAEGRSDGRGLAVLRTHEDAVAALVVNGRVMGDRTVQVTPGCEGDLEETASIRGPFLTEEEAQMAAPTQTVKPGDWMCPTCQFHNFASRRTCSKCHATNPSPTPYVSNQPLKPGDWICQDPACSFQNFASRMLCMRCRGPRAPRADHTDGAAGTEAISGGSEQSQIVRAGDWFCSQCNYHNFASRRDCAKCQADMTHSTGAGRAKIQNNPGSGKAGDWACPNQACGFHNFQYRNECKVCQAAKPNEGDASHPPQHVNSASRVSNAPRRGIEMRPGDWRCNACQSHNFASRRVCHKCNAPVQLHQPSSQGRHHAPPPSFPTHHHHHPHSHSHPHVQHHSPQPFNPTLRPGDWQCPDPACAFWNFRSKAVCTRCAGPSDGAQIFTEGYNQAPYHHHHNNNHPGGMVQQQQMGYPGNGHPSNSNYNSNQPTRREGDWDCPDGSCKFLNFRSRVACHRCGTAKPDEDGDEEGYDAESDYQQSEESDS